jgi:hypothetical protein
MSRDEEQRGRDGGREDRRRHTLQEGWLPTGASGGRARNALMQALRTAFIVP